MRVKFIRKDGTIGWQEEPKQYLTESINGKIKHNFGLTFKPQNLLGEKPRRKRNERETFLNR